MTTITCDSKSMAADGLITSNDLILQEDAVKIFRLDDGSLVGFAGNTYNWQSVIDYFNDCIKMTSNPSWPEVTGNHAILRLMPDGKAYTYDNKGRKWPRPTPTAIGSGRDYAMGAMLAGASPAKAVFFASKLDTHSGGIGRVIHLDGSINTTTVQA